MIAQFQQKHYEDAALHRYLITTKVINKVTYCIYV